MTTPPPPPRPASPPPWPPSPPAGRAGAPGPRRRGGVPQGLVLAVAALLGGLVVAAALVALSGRGDEAAAPGPPTTEAPPGHGGEDGQGGEGGEGPSQPPPSSAPGTTAPGSPPGAVEPIACPADVPAPICEAAEFVQREAGRPFQRFPTVELADDEGFRARLLDGADEDLAEAEAAGRTLAALGLLPPDLDVVATLRDLYEVGVVGFYDPETDELVVRGTEHTPYTRIVIVHELVHALDDQWYELHRPDQETSVDDEVPFGFSAVVEGHASVIEERYRSSLPAAEQRVAAQEELRLLLESDVDVSAIPAVLVELLSAPYVDGQPLVERILEQGGTPGLAEAFARPPVSSEQVLHPERYLAGEPALDVAPPPAEGPVVDEGVVGELGLRLWLPGDPEAARGWGGDRYVTWSVGPASCVRVDLAMDGERDLAEVRAALEAWAGRGERRTVEAADVAGRPGLRATGCAG